MGCNQSYLSYSGVLTSVRAMKAISTNRICDVMPYFFGDLQKKFRKLSDDFLHSKYEILMEHFSRYDIEKGRYDSYVAVIGFIFLKKMKNVISVKSVDGAFEEEMEWNPNDYYFWKSNIKIGEWIDEYASENGLSEEQVDYLDTVASGGSVRLQNFPAANVNERYRLRKSLKKRFKQWLESDPAKMSFLREEIRYD